VLFGLAFAQSLSGAVRDVISFELQDTLDEADDPQGKGRSVPLPSFDKTSPRVALTLFGLLLITQAAWILSAERFSQDHFWSLTEENAGSIGARREEARKAASIAVVRGDLWAESAFALVTQPWTDPASGLDHAFANRSRPAGYDTSALLKMSYYTAPNELGLLCPTAVGLAARRQ
jgi:hypothetical protein